MKKIIFCGFGKLGLKCLETLHTNNYSVVHIFTHIGLEEDSVDTYAKQKNISFSYFDMRSELSKSKDIFEKLQPVYLVSINYRYIIPEDIYSIPKYALNIHGSLLPKYRGRTPHVWNIINGEKYSGVTCHLIEHIVDSGDIIKQKIVPIDEKDTGFTLLEKYLVMYPGILIDSLKHLDRNGKLLKQNPEEATYFGKRIPEMGYIDFFKESTEVKNFVRAQAFPYPGAYYYLANGEKIIINSINESDFQFEGSIGQIKLINETYYVKCKNANLEILDCQIYSNQ
ncbi:methionyl-tRNA formyltransferase [Acetobacterium malicum]|uniref:Methionyl-tRNA formyltransferase n=1 Tax=Acetobacterium malicum TaxID=52692 RepID=A0ABR6YV31_9FIRM|nr:formyltransferase family protein [Acetobacterium malicum]MBC3899057.1 methionyl-tRNA formyltransferase [Acetobacterium malicum]